ncbi:hypothetical protein ACFYSC_18505 [Streptosporangium sp. NPDC004379]|uniref:hypothetical protein n=1 Tax=Streptosporangium sp. NPDC004379 TaxID=3366189 RepID=UPI003685E4B5
MDFWKAVFALVRRRFIGPPLLVLSLVAAALAFNLVPTTYVSTTSMVLTTPATGGTLPADPTRPIGLTNPLLQFSDGLRVTAGILILSMNTPEVAAELGLVQGGTTEITINDGRTNPDLLGISTNGPFVYVEVRSRSAAEAQSVVLKAKQRIRKELLTRQQALRAPRSTFISVVDVVPSSTPEAKITSKLMAAGGVLFAVLTVGFGVAYGVTEARASRRRRAAAPAGPFSAGPPSPKAAAPVAGAEPSLTVYPPYPPYSPYPPEDVRGSAEGPFHDEPAQLVVVLDEEEPPEPPGGGHAGRGGLGGDHEDFAEDFDGDLDDDHGERATDTVVFTRAGGRGEE